MKPLPAPRRQLAAVEAPPPGERKRDLTLPFVALGASAVTAGVATVFALQARSAAGAVAGSRTPDEYAANRDKADSAARRTNLAWAGAGVIAAASAALFYLKF